MDHDVTTVIAVTLEDKADGELLVYSDDLPGLILGGPDRDAVCDAIAPAIAALFAYQGLGEVSVKSATPLSEILKLQSPRNADMHVRSFIVELKRAAQYFALDGRCPTSEPPRH